MKRPVYKTPNMAHMVLTMREIDAVEAELYEDLDAFYAPSECASSVPSVMYEKRVEAIRCFEKQNGISFQHFLDDLRKWIDIAVRIQCINTEIWYHALHEWKEAFHEMCLNRERMLKKRRIDCCIAIRLQYRYYHSWSGYRHQEAHQTEIAVRNACYIATIACCPIPRHS